jgi:hypothetical protein
MTLPRVHEWLSEHGFAFAVLFGIPSVYGSSGYVEVDNLVHGGERQGWHPVKAMVKELAGTSWPRTRTRLRGATF